MTRRFLPLLLAIVLAGVGTAAVLAYVRGADARALAGKKAVAVLVAAKHIPAGTPAEMVRAGGFVEKVQMPAETVPVDALATIGADLDSLVTTGDLAPRQLILRGHFGPETKVAVGLPIPAGKIAVSVQLQTPASVAGYVVPGSKIAIFDTFNVLGAKGSRVPTGDGLSQGHEFNRATVVLVPRADVIAVGAYGFDGTTSAPAPSPTPSPSSGSGSGAAQQQSSGQLMVTVAVSQSDAERLVHGVQSGALYLALLSDASIVKPGIGVDNNNLVP